MVRFWMMTWTVTCILVGLEVGPARAQTSAGLPVATDVRSHGVSQNQIDSLATLMRQAVAQKQVAGCSFLVAHQGQVVFRQAVGLADIEAKRPFTTCLLYTSPSPRD